MKKIDSIDRTGVILLGAIELEDCVRYLSVALRRRVNTCQDRTQGVWEKRLSEVVRVQDKRNMDMVEYSCAESMESILRSLFSMRL